MATETGENKYKKYGQPSLDLVFTGLKKSLTDRVGNVAVEFTRNSTATYVGSDGLIKSAAVNEARFDHDKDGNGLGLLIEESRTNSFQYSTELDNAYWDLATGLTKTANNAVSPDGNTTALLVTEDTSTGEHVFGKSTNVPVSFNCMGIFVKPNGKTRVGLRQGTESTANVVFDLSGSGSVVSGNGFIEQYPNGWFRVTQSRQQSTGNKTYFHLLNNADDALSYTGDGTSGCWIWGYQKEAGTFPTSIIPTTSSTVTRSADVASLTNSSIYDTDSFTILNEPFGSAAGASTLSLIGAGQTPIKRTTVYSQDLTQTQINASVGKTDEFWQWRILGSSFGLPNFTTDGQVTVDWGDGTVETLTTSDHTFTDGGGYHEIGFRLDSGTYFRPFINDNASHDTKVVAVGPAPESMKLDGSRTFDGCSNLESFDATVDATGGTSFESAWRNCTSLTSFPLIDTSSGTFFSATWSNCTGLTSFPLLNTSSGTNFNNTWNNCTGLTSFPLIDTSSGTNFGFTWRNCSSLTSFPAIDTSSGTDFQRAWDGCNSLTSFSLINTAAGTNFTESWRACSSLTSFPAIDTSSGTDFQGAWRACSSLTSFPANFFDSWTGTPGNNCFVNTWDGCSSLLATSVENILNSIDTSGRSAPASGVDITIDYNASSGTPSISTAVTNLKSRGWTITLNGVAQ